MGMRATHKSQNNLSFELSLSFLFPGELQNCENTKKHSITTTTNDGPHKLPVHKSAGPHP
jgi:hypothetical protein